MKVLHLNALYHPYSVGGAERSVQALAEAQLARGMEPVVVSLCPRRAQRIAWVNGVKVHYVELKNFYWPFAAVAAPRFRKPLWHALETYNPLMTEALDRVLEAERPDLLHTHNLTGFSVSAWRAADRHKRPVVHTLRDYSLLCPKATMFANGRNCPTQHLSCRAFSAVRMALSRGVKAVTAISRYVLDRHLAAGAFTDVAVQAVIHNSEPPRPESAPSRAAASRPFTFGFIGQLTPAKGVDVLLRAFSELPAGDCELLIAGKGEASYEDVLKADAAGRNVRFLGVVRPDEFYPLIDALVVPSLWHEPFGRVILEAYSFGVPVIASDRGGIPEIADDLQTGILFDPDDPEALRAALEKLSCDRALAAKLASNAFVKLKRFSPEAVCDQYDSVYARVAER